jgi:hypothetical protein
MELETFKLVIYIHILVSYSINIWIMKETVILGSFFFTSRNFPFASEHRVKPDAVRRKGSAGESSTAEETHPPRRPRRWLGLVAR